MGDLHELTALETAAAVRRREVGVLDVVDHALRRAETVGAAVGAFAVLTPDRARDAARALDAALAAGEVAGAADRRAAGDQGPDGDGGGPDRAGVGA